MRSAIRRFMVQTLVCALFSAAAVGAESKSLQIFFVDVEGGQATLVVTPSGQSLLIDTGWPGFGGRDAGRIVSAAKAAGADRIDYVLITHFHRDHVGGVTQLASQIKIGTFIDHGSNLEDAAAPREDFAAYEKVAAKSKRVIVKPGDQIPMKDLTVEVLTAAGEHISCVPAWANASLSPASATSRRGGIRTSIRCRWQKSSAKSAYSASLT